jgi:hypothetical protein
MMPVDKPFGSIDKLYLQKYYQPAARVRRFTTTLRYVEMKNIVRLSVLSALALGTSLPAFCAPSDADMGFAGGREPTAADVGYQGVLVRGYRNETNAGGAYAGADDGDAGGSHNTEHQSSDDRKYFKKGDTRDVSQYLIDLPYRADPGAQSQTKQHLFQHMTSDKGWQTATTGVGLLSRNSVSDVNFKGPQTLGFKGPGPITPYAMGHKFGALMLSPVGTGSVNASITSRNGKD